MKSSYYAKLNSPREDETTAEESSWLLPTPAPAPAQHLQPLPWQERPNTLSHILSLVDY